jgi:hypothetical protein
VPSKIGNSINDGNERWPCIKSSRTRLFSNKTEIAEQCKQSGIAIMELLYPGLFHLIVTSNFVQKLRHLFPWTEGRGTFVATG